MSDADIIKDSSGTVVINGLTIGKSEPLYNSGKFTGSWAKITKGSDKIGVALYSNSGYEQRQIVPGNSAVSSLTRYASQDFTATSADVTDTYTETILKY